MADSQSEASETSLDRHEKHAREDVPTQRHKRRVVQAQTPPRNEHEAKSQKLGIGSHRPTIYDAVAGQSFSYPDILLILTTSPGRVNVRGRITNHISEHGWPLTPEDVLFRSSKAPTRYEEDDIYFQNEKLRPNQSLPDSDLLKTLHAYTSDYYYCSAANEPPSDFGRADFCSMDETALLALGILMEEAARQRLGKTGDLALVEPEDEDEIEWPMVWTGREWVKRIIRTRKKYQTKRKRGVEHRADEGDVRSRRVKTEEAPRGVEEDPEEAND
ncbi:MAG: hypothetical protein M1821_001083 [Bathelium mastoideum]|nr:MAG: hypothetical protein M1821_001083 [Bathelium mastoideum]